jgi:hypothetical protein
VKPKYKHIIANSKLDKNNEEGTSEFSTEGEAIAFYTMYAHLHGFAIRKDDVKRYREQNIVMRQLLCNKEGTSDGHLRPTM